MSETTSDAAPVSVDQAPVPVDRFEWERVVRRVSMPKGCKVVAYTLGTFADQDGSRVHPGVKFLALSTEVAERTVMRHLKWLRENGFIDRVKHGNRHDNESDDYRLTLPSDVLDRIVVSPNGTKV